MSKRGKRPEDERGRSRLLAVALPTTCSGGMIAEAVESVLACDHPTVEVHVIDQGPNGALSPKLAALLVDARVRYHVQRRLGLSAAINLAARSTEAEILAITGDDCVVDPSWLSELLHAFDDERTGVVFGNVLPGPAINPDEFVPGCLVTDGVVLADAGEIHKLSGTTACMAIRRSTWEALGGFDERLGVGTRLRSAEDLDFALRALLHGILVVQTPRPAVVHRSSTPIDERAALIRRNWFGSGAALAKCAKLAPIRATVALAHLGRRWQQGGSAVADTYGPRPDRAAMLTGFARGFAAGLLTPVDPATRHFRPDRRGDQRLVAARRPGKP